MAELGQRWVKLRDAAQTHARKSLRVQISISAGRTSSEHVSAMEQMSLPQLTSAGLGFLSRFVLKMWSGVTVGNLM